MARQIMEYLGIEGMYARAVIIFTILLLRYVVFAGGAFLIFYVFRKEYRKLYRKIQTKFPKNKDYRREILYSLSTFVIFALLVLLILNPAMQKYTWTYKHISDYGWGYFIGSIIAMIFIHDAYFYWTHRAMHHPKVFKYFHKVHHLSKNPSPWAAFSFHPLEAVVEFSIILIFVFGFPTHPLATLIFLFFMTIENVLGHVGYELYPKGANKHWLGKWFNTSTNHNMHHEYFKGNYGLYFTIWDRLMGTMHPKYDERFEQVTSQPKPTRGQDEDKIPATGRLVHDM